MEALKALGSLVGIAGARLSVDEEIAKKKIVVPSPPVIEPAVPIRAKPRLLTTAELLKYYGQPGRESDLIRIPTPYPLKIAWDTIPPYDTVTSFLCHKKCVKNFENIMKDILTFYGYTRIVELGIDLFGGCYNKRPQRGLEKKYNAAIAAGNMALAVTYLSRHSWATAWDLDPARNTLRETAKTARFARVEYKQMIEAHYDNGFIGYGPERNNDWMHFEAGFI
jgi:hypothetical protein